MNCSLPMTNLLHPRRMTNVLTVRVDSKSQARFDHLRQLHFPPSRNLIAAHVTLFHTLPNEAWVTAQLLKSALELTAFSIGVTGVRSLGKGVAYTLASAPLQNLHRTLSQAFVHELTPQDRQRFQPHVVVQNKVTPAAAQILLRSLESDFVPWSIEALGLDLWHYLGGPWELAETFLFGSTNQA